MTEPATERVSTFLSRDSETDADGHRWHSQHYVSDWIRRHERDADAAYQLEYKRRIEAMLQAIPHDRAAPLCILDIGAGWGRLAAHLLRSFPASNLVAHDFSQPMREEARLRLLEFASRIEFVDGNLEQQNVLTGLNRHFDVVVSAATLHHVSEVRLGSLCREIYAVLKPGGVFVNLDRVRRRSVALLQALERSAGDGAVAHALAALQLMIGAGAARDTCGATHPGYLRMLRSAGFHACSRRVGGLVLTSGAKASSGCGGSFLQGDGAMGRIEC